MQPPVGTMVKRLTRFGAVATACVLLPFTASAQVVGPSDEAANARPAGLPRTRFDLAWLIPPSDVTNRDAGDDVEVAPGLVAGIGATDRRRGAAAPVDTVAPAFQRQTELSGRLGLAMGGDSLVFGRLGYGEFDVNEAFARSDARALSTGGVLVGAGADARISPALSLRTEYHTVSYRSDLADRQLLGGLAWRY